MTHGELICTRCGQTGHVAANCKRPYMSRDAMRRLVLGYLATRPDGMRAGEIAELIDAPRASVDTALTALRKLGEADWQRMSISQSCSAYIWRTIKHMQAAHKRQAEAKPVGIVSVSKRTPLALRSGEVIYPANVKRTACPPTPDRWAVTVPAGGGQITRDWMARRAAQ